MLSFDTPLEGLATHSFHLSFFSLIPSLFDSGDWILIPRELSAAILSQILFPVWRFRVWYNPGAYIERLMPALRTDLIDRGDFDDDTIDQALERLRSAAAKGRVTSTFFAYKSKTGYSHPTRPECYLRICLWWSFHRTLKNKVLHEVVHHCVAIQIEKNTRQDVCRQEFEGTLPPDVNSTIEREVCHKSDPTDPIRKAFCVFESRCLEAGPWLAHHPTVTWIVLIAGFVLGAKVVLGFLW